MRLLMQGMEYHIGCIMHIINHLIIGIGYIR